MGFLTRNVEKFEDKIEDRPELIQVLAEGDSWFAIGDTKHILRQLSRKTKLNILSLASSGDEAIEMMSWEQKSKIHRLLEDKDNEYDFKLLLFSAGGNDIVGPEMWHLLNEYDPSMKTSEDCINKKVWNIKMTQIEMIYRELIEIRNNLKPNLDIVTHTYDQTIPSGKGHKVLIFKVAGPWMKPSMDKRGIPRKLHQGIVDFLLTAMRKTLLRIQAEENNFHVIDSWDTLRNPDLWSDELHPNNKGYKKIVDEKWIPALKQILEEAL